MLNSVVLSKFYTIVKYNKLFEKRFFYNTFNVCVDQENNFRNIKLLDIVFGDMIFFCFKNVNNVNLILLYIKNSYKTVRIFFGYPIKGRTRSNARSSELLKRNYRQLLLDTVFSVLFFSEKPNDKHNFLFIEFFNKIWFFFWLDEWYSSFSVVTKASTVKFTRWKFSYLFLTYNRPIVFSKKKNNKKKNNKKKNIQLKNTFNVGFYYGFTVNNRDFVKKFNVSKKKIIC